MARTSVKVTIGDNEYDVPVLNFGQGRRVTDVFQGPMHHIFFDVLKIAFERVEPKVNLDDLPIDFEQARDAAKQILMAAGFKELDDKTAQSDPTTAAP